MKHFGKIGRSLIASFCSMVSVMGYAYDYEVDGIYYDLKGDGLYLEVVDFVPNKQSGNSYEGDVKVPSSVMISDLGKSLPVKSVAKNAFSASRKLNSVYLPESIESIGEDAFASCTALKSVDMSATSVESIPQYAFGGDYSLNQVSLPSVLKKIGSESFYGCRALAEIELPNKLEEIGGNAFAETGLVEIIVPNSVSTVGDMAFSGCQQLKKAVLGNSLKVLEWYTFSTCRNLTEIKLPDNLEVIEEGALTDTKISELELPSTLRQFYPMFNVKTIKSITCHVENPWQIQLGETGLVGVGLYDCDPNASMLTNTFPTDVCDYGKCTLYVPDGCEDQYKSAPGWSKFGTILPIDKSALAEIESGEPENSIYDLMGRKVRSVQPNRVYIVNGRKVVK